MKVCGGADLRKGRRVNRLGSTDPTSLLLQIGLTLTRCVIKGRNLQIIHKQTIDAEEKCILDNPKKALVGVQSHRAVIRQ